MSLEVEIEAQDIIRLVLQFCAENNLSRTMEVLQEESQVSLNTVDSLEAFQQDILQGNWDAVLQAVSRISIPADKLMLLYDQVCVEMIELGEKDVARSILRESRAMELMKQVNSMRYMKLEGLLNKPFFDVRDAYPDGTTKEKRRTQIALALGTEVQVVPPARLLTLLNHSVKWQQYAGLLPPGSKFDMFRGQAPAQVDTVDECPTQLYKQIKFVSKSYAETARFSPDGKFFASGSYDGFIEVWDYETGRLSRDLRFQAEDQFMTHPETVLSVAFSRDSELMVSGDKDGQLKVWKVQSGQCLRKIEKAHTLGITSCCFSRDSMQLLSASYDMTVRIHGLKSGKLLKEFRGHKSYVNDVQYTNDGSRLLSASADGTVKVWDVKTMQELTTFRPPSANPALTINCALPLPKHPDHVLVCPKASTAFIITLDGKIVKTLSNGKREGADFIAACLSPRGDWAYCIGEDKALYCFTTSDAKLEHTLPLGSGDTVGITHHPQRNLVATFHVDGLIKLWSPR